MYLLLLVEVHVQGKCFVDREIQIPISGSCYRPLSGGMTLTQIPFWVVNIRFSNPSIAGVRGDPMVVQRSIIQRKGGRVRSETLKPRNSNPEEKSSCRLNNHVASIIMPRFILTALAYSENFPPRMSSSYRFLLNKLTGPLSPSVGDVRENGWLVGWLRPPSRP